MAITEELSSGAIIVRKVGGAWEVLCIRDMSGNLTFPKGLMEKRESIKDTAIREAREETGISGLTYVAPLPDVFYFYTRSGITIHKTVHYQLFVYEGSETLVPQKEEGISEILWIPLATADTVIGYPRSNQPVIHKVKTILKTYHDH